MAAKVEQGRLKSATLFSLSFALLSGLGCWNSHIMQSCTSKIEMDVIYPIPHVKAPTCTFSASRSPSCVLDPTPVLPKKTSHFYHFPLSHRDHQLLLLLWLSE